MTDIETSGTCIVCKGMGIIQKFEKFPKLSADSAFQKVNRYTEPCPACTSKTNT